MKLIDRLARKLGANFPAKELVILDLLMQRGEMYGLEMVKASSQLKRGTVYVTLNRMQDKGLITSKEVEPPEGSFGRARRVYEILAEGRATYNAWTQFAKTMDASWEGATP